MLHAVDRWLSVVTNQIVAIQVMPFGIEPVQPLVDSIWIEHWDYYYLKIFPQCFRIFLLAEYVLNYAFDRPAGWTLSRMYSPANQNHGLMEEFLFVLQMFFGQNYPVRQLSDYLLIFRYSIV